MIKRAVRQGIVFVYPCARQEFQNHIPQLYFLITFAKYISHEITEHGHKNQSQQNSDCKKNTQTQKILLIHIHFPSSLASL